MRPKLLSVSLLLSCLCACSKSHETSQGSASESHYYNIVAQSPALSPEQAKKTAIESALVCETNADCATNVGMLVATRQAGNDMTTHACTASLIGPSSVLTNAHCLPKELRRANASCQNRVWIHFPNLAAQDCKQVLFSTNGEVNGQNISGDLAILELAAPLDIAVLELSAQQSADTLKLIKVDSVFGPTHETFQGIQRSSLCQLARNNIYLPITNHSPLFAYGNCKAKPGNSGSPMVDSQGKARALFQDLNISSTSREDAPIRMHIRTLMQLDVAEPLPLLLFAANLADLHVNPIDYTADSVVTLANHFEKVLRPDRLNQEQNQKEVHRLLEAWIETQAPITQWRIAEVSKESALVRRFAPQRTCTRPDIQQEVPAVSVYPSLNSLYELSFSVKTSAENWTLTAEALGQLPACDAN